MICGILTDVRLSFRPADGTGCRLAGPGRESSPVKKSPRKYLKELILPGWDIFASGESSPWLPANLPVPCGDCSHPWNAHPF